MVTDTQVSPSSIDDTDEVIQRWVEEPQSTSPWVEQLPQEPTPAPRPSRDPVVRS